MKKIGLIILCAFFCSLTINSYAQSNAFCVEDVWYMNFTCDGVVNNLFGTMELHGVEHLNPKTGVLEWAKLSFKSDNLTNQVTGEVFAVSFFRKFVFDGPDFTAITRFNLRGDQGSHIHVTKYWQVDGGVWTTTEEAKCK